MELGFDSVLPNSLSAVADRDFVLETMQWGSFLMLHIPRWAEDLIIYSSLDFGFVRLADMYSTGSSPLPQKKNPDSLKQESVEPLIDHIQTLGDSIQIAMGVLTTLSTEPENMRQALTPEMLATGFADYLVRKGVPFREGHHISGRIVQLAEKHGIAVDQLSFGQLKSIDSRFQEDVQECFDYNRAVEMKDAEGGTSKRSVLAQVKLLKEKAGAK